MEKEGFAEKLLKWFAGDEPGSATVILDSHSKSFANVDVTSESDRFEILKVLGKGNFGIVYLARDLRIGRMIAVKQLYSKFDQSTDIYQRFLQEARIAGQIDNPNIVTIYDVDMSKAPTIHMEYLAGGNLGTLMRIDGILLEKNALQFLIGILNGLDDAHRMGVVHRDIKPENIIFDQSGHPKISDFGVAHIPVESGGLNSDEDQTMVAGTPDYMAPEQVDPNMGVDQRTDIYSCGILLFQMLTGNRLYHFHGEREIEKIADIIHQSKEPAEADFPNGTTMKLRQICLKMLKHNPDHRYQNCQELLIDLEDLIDSPIETQAKISKQVYPELFRDLVRIYLVDGIISAAERREIFKRSKRLGLDLYDANEIEEEVRLEQNLPLHKHLQAFEYRTEQLLADMDYSEKDKKALQQLGNKYNISQVEQEKILENVMIKFKMKEGIVEELT